MNLQLYLSGPGVHQTWETRCSAAGISSLWRETKVNRSISQFKTVYLGTWILKRFDAWKSSPSDKNNIQNLEKFGWCVGLKVLEWTVTESVLGKTQYRSVTIETDLQGHTHAHQWMRKVNNSHTSTGLSFTLGTLWLTSQFVIFYYLPKCMVIGPAIRAPAKPPNEKMETMIVHTSVTW